MPPFYFRCMRGFLLLFLLMAIRAQAAGPYHAVERLPAVVQEALAADTVQVEAGEPRRAVAAVLALTLGPFGAHRLYLGTSPKVPVAYGLTFGAFGILPLIDLGHILFTKDLERYMNDRRILMWTAPEAGGGTQP